MKKKVLSLVLALVMVLSLVPVSAFAAETVDSGKCGTSAKWTLDDEGTLTISGSGAIRDYTTEDPDPVWQNNKNVKKLVIKEGITSIGIRNFEHMPALTEVSLPSTLKTIGPYAFYDCEALPYIKIPNSVTKIDIYAFAGCKALKEMVLPKSLKTIASGTFHYSGLETIEIPSTVTSIGQAAFQKCYKLTEIVVPKGVTTISMEMFRDCYNLEAIALYGTLTTVERYAFDGCDSLAAILWLGNASDLADVSVSTRGNDPFLNCGVYLGVLPTKQPKDATTSVGGKSITLSTAASHSKAKFLWMQLVPGAEEWTEAKGLTGYKTKKLTVPADAKYDGYQFACYMYVDDGDGIRENATAPVTVTVLPAPEITVQPVGVKVKGGEMATVTLEATGSSDLTYEWYYAAAGSSTYKKTTSFTGPEYSIEMNESRAGRKVYCKVIDKYGASVTTDKVTLAMDSELLITQQPADVQAASGKTAAVTVKASGLGLKYEWYWAAPGSDDFKLTTSFKTNTYSISMNESRDGRRVYCKVYDKFGNMVQSDIATLTMVPPPQIVVEPTYAYAKKGEEAVVSFEATGTGELTYEWYWAKAGSSTYKKTTSFTGPEYKVEMDDSRAGRKVYCVVTDETGVSVKTKTVTLRMELEITEDLADVAVELGEKAAVTVKANGQDLTYEWFYADNGGDFKKTTSFKTATYSVTMTEARAGRQVYCRITDKYGNIVETATATLSAKAVEKTPLAITAQPHDVTVNEGEKAAVEVKATGDGLSYEWHFSDDGGESYHVTTTFTTGVYSVTMNEARAGRRVYCIITDQYGESVTSETAILGMN